MSGRRRLPLVTEQSLASLRQVRVQYAQDFEQELQRLVQREKIAVTCRKGCAHCCHHPVLITAMEGALLFSWLSERGRWTPSFQARVKEHAEKTKDLPFEVWFLSLIPCPLLDEAQKCTAYEARPYQCRVTYSFGDPESCHPHRIESTGMINKQPVLAAYHKAQRAIAKKHNLQTVLLPISMALLIGEQIIRGQIDMEDVDRAILLEFEKVK